MLTMGQALFLYKPRLSLYYFGQPPLEIPEKLLDVDNVSVHAGPHCEPLYFTVHFQTLPKALLCNAPFQNSEAASLSSAVLIWPS